MKQLGFCLAICLLISSVVRVARAADELLPGKQIATSLKVVVGDEKKEETVRYLQFLPQQYKADGPAFPVILFLHGSGERGTDIEVVKKWGPPSIVEKQADFPFIVISPQCPPNQGWDARVMVPLVDHVCKTLNADADRVAITGLSMGGRGTWDTLVLAPNRFSAGVPLCGPGDISTAEKLVHIPIKAYVGAKDTQRVVDGMTELTNAIKKAGGKQVEFTIYPELGHNIWSDTYAKPELYEWIKQQKRAK